MVRAETYRYVARRTIQIVIILLIIITINFLIPRLMPGNPADRIANDPRLDEESRAKIYASFGLDKPLWEQYVLYLQHLFQGDFGTSFHFKRPVMDVIAERIPYTLILVGTATVLAIIIGILLGAYAAWKRGGRVDTAVLSLSVVLHTLPTFWLGLIFLLLFAFFLPIFPLYGFGGVGIKDPVLYFLDVAWHCALPIITMTLTHFTSYALIMRNTVLTVLGEEFITAAKAFGLAERKILYGHVLRNAMLPMVTLIGLSIAGIFSGAILIETVFSWPGMGRLIVQSALWYDYPLMQAIFLLLAVITILANFAADLVYGLVDPRVKLR